MLSEPSQGKQWKGCYSGGFGEPVQIVERGPSYSGAPAAHGQAPNLTETSFYTRNDVIILANWLQKNCIEQGYNAIYLQARSCGAGTAINCLYKLIHYDEDPQYFEGSEIKSLKDAQAIIQAINNGALEFTVPFLDLRKANVLIIASQVGGYGATFFIILAVWHKMQMRIPRGLLAFGFLVVSFCLGKALSSNVSAPISDHKIVSSVTHGNYDASHIRPIEALEGLGGHIKCPVLIHFSRYDGVLQNTVNDIISMYNAFKTGNKKNTYILYADDDSHNEFGNQYATLRKKFQNMIFQNGRKIEGYQPTVQKLKRIINPLRYPLWLKYKRR